MHSGTLSASGPRTHLPAHLDLRQSGETLGGSSNKPTFIFSPSSSDEAWIVCVHVLTTQLKEKSAREGGSGRGGGGG